jgi:hypothetical protein
VINAVGGPKGYNDIEIIVDETEDALRQTQHVLPPGSSLDVNAKYADAITHIADDWRINALGRPISDLKEAPLGYCFYPKKNPEGLRRLDANDPKTPQLKVENGIVVVVNRYADNLSGVAKGTHQTLVSGGVRHIDDGITIKYLTKEGEEFAKVENGTVIITNAKGSRPDPSTYLDKNYIEKHLVKFEKEGVVSRVVLKEDYEDFGVGKPDAGKTEFVSTKSEIDDILKLPLAEQSKKHGIPESQLLGGGVVRVDFKLSSKNKIEMPSGNEWGANKQWIPGGKLPEGNLEAIIKTEGMIEGVDFNVIVIQ